MKTSPRILFLSTTLLAALSGNLLAESASQPPGTTPEAKEKRKYSFLSSLLPKSLQEHPLLAISIITEMTDLGKKLTPPTAEKPSYYLIKSMGYHHEGQAVYEEGKVPVKNLERIVHNALAGSHYLPADKDHPATLCLYYFWGIHSKLDGPDQETGMGGTIDIGNKHLLSRAQLVGGVKFAKELGDALEARALSVNPGDNKVTGIDPVEMFTIRTKLNQSLMEQVVDDCYYFVVSAYDAGALQKGDRKLLWRTKISTAADGASIAETTPALVATGEAFFGRDMNEPSIVDKRLNRKGNVGMGETKTMEMDGEPTEKSAKEDPAEKK